MNNKLLSYLLMAHAEKDKSLVDERDGSRKNRHSAKTALKKVLFLDILRLLRRAGALTSNDARKCYDRMNHRRFAVFAVTLVHCSAARARFACHVRCTALQCLPLILATTS